MGSDSNEADEGAEKKVSELTELVDQEKDRNLRYKPRLKILEKVY